MDYKIADVDSKDFKAIKDAENLVRTETGKDLVLIAWEKVTK